MGIRLAHAHAGRGWFAPLCPRARTSEPTVFCERPKLLWAANDRSNLDGRGGVCLCLQEFFGAAQNPISVATGGNLRPARTKHGLGRLPIRATHL